MSYRQYPIYRRLALLVNARATCIERGNKEWKITHEDEIERLVKEYLPSGGGFDNGTKFDFVHSTDEKLVFDTSFHHMNEHGSYDGWTEHRVTVRASLAHDIVITISGRNRNDVKDYIFESFDQCLRTIEASVKQSA